MAGGDGVISQVETAFQQGRELDPLIASQAGIGRATGLVLSDEGVNDLLGEAVGEIPHVERDPQLVRGPPGVEGILQGAASS